MGESFERDFAKGNPPWTLAPPEIMDWTREILRQPETAERTQWLIRHPDGRRWVGMRVGVFLVDRASRGSGRSPAALVFMPIAEIIRLADLPE